MKPKLSKFDAPSGVFKDVICDAGTPQAQCDFCGRTYYVENGENMEPRELEELQRKRNEKPEFYIPISNANSISFGILNGKCFVWHCDCNYITAYEKFIIDHRQLIVRYLKKRALKLTDIANRETLLALELDE